ncbi:MAG: MFS transporter, partial [Betaproteobacteria bacterium]|nr:MFS transporter [Betaproteobacteria bacterium]
MNVRLPFFYGWVIVAAAFITMGIGVNARTAFSLLLPPIIGEFGWDRGLVAGAFSFGFFVSAFFAPFVGRLMDQRGPLLVVEIGVILTALGLGLAAFAHEPWQFYGTLGFLVATGANFLGYGVQSQLIPRWFVRRRGLAIGIAFAGVGIGSIVLLPWMQIVIARDGWRDACLGLAIITGVVLIPLNLLLRKRPQDIGLHPDGDAAPISTQAGHAANIV